jgi:outer membrane protein OmpA-like peptidoglycan-associated protein
MQVYAIRVVNISNPVVKLLNLLYLKIPCMKTALSFVFILLSQVALLAQTRSKADLKEFFYDAEYFFAREEYIDALYDYNELYKNGYNENANINYRMGVCYLNIPGVKEKAIDHLLVAVKNVSKKYSESKLNQETAPLDAYLFLGNAYRVNNRLQDAIQAYNKYKEVADNPRENGYADQQIAACNTALKFMSNPVAMKYTNLGDSVNGNSSNFKAVISGDGKTLLYMNELPFYNAVYFSQWTPKGWSSPVNITPQIQSDGDQYVTSVSYDGKKLYLTREDAYNSDIYTSVYQNGRWSKSVAIPDQGINTKYWESHASISKDGKTLYFTSNRKDGIGDMDIYVSKLQANGQWGEPKNLGTTINTPLNEDTPFITENDSLLFFSSQGHDNMGGYDIFVSHLQPSGAWSEPMNLGYPINTTDDDLFYYPWDNNRVAYVSLIQNDGYGKEDIYAMQKADDKPLADVLTEFFGPSIQPAPVVAEVPSAATEINAPDAAKQTGALAQTDANKTEVAQPVLKPEPKEMELAPVYFDFDVFELNEAGKVQADKIYQLMKDYPMVRLRLMGHADSKGPADYNIVLSERRSAVVKNYLISKGIDASRMETIGLGEKNFVAINSNPDGSDNPEGRQLNRRVEYEIIGSADNVLRIKMPPIPDHLKIRP